MKIHNRVILPLDLYRCETWSVVTLRDKHTLRVFENRLLRTISESREGK